MNGPTKKSLTARDVCLRVTRSVSNVYNTFTVILQQRGQQTRDTHYLVGSTYVYRILLEQVYAMAILLPVSQFTEYCRTPSGHDGIRSGANSWHLLRRQACRNDKSSVHRRAGTTRNQTSAKRRRKITLAADAQQIVVMIVRSARFR